jgi:tRNA U34 5-methylaminomethyl-2-thiouridine-forming methyltransferase MnmC
MQVLVQQTHEQFQALPTEDGSFTVFSERYSQTYHSKDGARFESQKLYIECSSIQGQLNADHAVTVLDVGLGLGYNALTTVDAWWNCRAPMHMVSLEHNAALVQELLSTKGAWQANWPEHWKSLCENFKSAGADRVQLVAQNPLGVSLHWDILIGDAQQTLAHYEGPALNYIWQDAFSSGVNPELWSADWFALLKDRADKNAELLTYSAARVVKDALTTSGWAWELIKGSGNKKHWLKATPKD